MVRDERESDRLQSRPMRDNGGTRHENVGAGKQSSEERRRSGDRDVARD